MKPGNVYWVRFEFEFAEAEILRTAGDIVEYRTGGLRFREMADRWANRKPVYLGRAKKFLGFRYGLDPVPESQT